MASIDAEVDQTLLELVRTSKRIAEPFEEAYHWMMQFGVQLHPQEIVGTLAFASKGKRKTKHLIWSEVISFHQAYERLGEIEEYLKARELEKHLVVPTDDHDPE